MRILALPGAAIAVIAIPFIIVAAQREEEAPPDPRAAALTVHLEGEEGGSVPAHVHFTGSGLPPAPGRAFRLVDATGLKTAEGRVLSATPPATANQPAESCRGAELRRTGVEGAETEEAWCLQLKNVAVGSELKGTITGRPITGRTGEPDTPATRLALTVTRRDAFVGLPLLVMIAGLVVGGLTALVPQRVRGFVKRVVLARVLDENRGAAPNVRIGGLDAWVSDRLRSGMAAADVLPLIAEVVKRGPQEAGYARGRLTQAIDGAASVRAAHPFIVAAKLEAAKTTHEVSDFIDSEGKEKAHPADVWAQGVTRLVEIASVLGEHKRTIDEQLTTECQEEPTRKLNEAWVTANAVKEPADLVWLEPRLEELRTAIEDALGREGCRSARALAEEGEVKAATLEEAPPSPDPLVTGGNWLGAATFAGVLMTALVLGVTLIFAGATVYAAAYEGKVTFADRWSDYFPLFTAALGSGAAASALTMLAYWQREGPPEEA